MFNFLDLSGVGNSGKSAIVDLLKEVESVAVSDTTFEFDILRVHGGLLDLRHALVTDWSPVRSNEAIKVFKSRVKTMGVDPRPYNLIGLIESSSQRYNKKFNGEFVSKFEAFCDSLIIGQYKASWPYDRVSENSYLRFLKKIIGRFGVKSINDSSVFMVSGSGFDLKVKNLMESLYGAIFSNDTSWVTLNNAFEPYNPLPFFKMLPNSKQIVILRDPRDIYVSGKTPKNTVGKDKKLLTDYHQKTNFSFLGSDDLDIFIKRYELYRNNVMVQEHPSVLQINFEDLCLNYDATIKKVFSFLGVDSSKHSARGMYFKPDVSKKNVSLWKNYSNQDEISHIEKQLSGFLYRI